MQLTSCRCGMRFLRRSLYRLYRLLEALGIALVANLLVCNRGGMIEWASTSNMKWKRGGDKDVSVVGFRFSLPGVSAATTAKWKLLQGLPRSYYKNLYSHALQTTSKPTILSISSMVFRCAGVWEVYCLWFEIFGVGSG